MAEEAMEDLIKLLPLFHAGGLVVLAAVLFYLHVTSWKYFREDGDKDRALFREQIGLERAQAKEATTEITNRLDEHSKILQAIMYKFGTPDVEHALRNREHEINMREAVRDATARGMGGRS
jgi:hypothetical protein